ncbi:MAG: hypothetical protein ACTHYR_16885 [Brachybacterium sp.]
MRARRLVVIAACAAFGITGCSGKDAADSPSPSEPTNVATEAPSPAETEDALFEAYMDDDGPKDVTSHKACLDWTKPVGDTELTGDPAMNVAARAIRSDDADMAATAMEAGIGPMITDPWGMTEVCINQGYEYEDGSLASKYYIESLMG